MLLDPGCGTGGIRPSGARLMVLADALAPSRGTDPLASAGVVANPMTVTTVTNPVAILR